MSQFTTPIVATANTLNINQNTSSSTTDNERDIIMNNTKSNKNINNDNNNKRNHPTNKNTINKKTKTKNKTNNNNNSVDTHTKCEMCISRVDSCTTCKAEKAKRQTQRLANQKREQGTTHYDTTPKVTFQSKFKDKCSKQWREDQTVLHYVHNSSQQARTSKRKTKSPQRSDRVTIENLVDPEDSFSYNTAPRNLYNRKRNRNCKKIPSDEVLQQYQAKWKDTIAQLQGMSNDDKAKMFQASLVRNVMRTKQALLHDAMRQLTLNDAKREEQLPLQANTITKQNKALLDDAIVVSVKLLDTYMETSTMVPKVATTTQTNQCTHDAAVVADLEKLRHPHTEPDRELVRSLLQQREKAIYIVNLLVKGHPVSCLLDTGCDVSIIDTKLLVQLQIPYVDVPIKMQGASVVV